MKAKFKIQYILVVLFVFIFFQSEILAQKGTLYQAGYNGSSYQYGFNSSPTLYIKGAPEDIDWERWSILHDGSVYRLYFMAIGRSDILYQFGYNPFSGAYEFGYESLPRISVVGLPNNTNVTNFSILFDGVFYRLYFKSSDNFSLYQCAFNTSTLQYEFAYESIPEIQIIGAPQDINIKSWTMLHDGDQYRLYFSSKVNPNKLYQFGFNGRSYNYGYNSTPIIFIEGMPQKNYVRKFNITHDGSLYRFYRLVKTDEY